MEDGKFKVWGGWFGLLKDDLDKGDDETGHVSPFIGTPALGTGDNVLLIDAIKSPEP